MKNSKVNYPQYVKELSMSQKFILLCRALNIHYGNGILIMLESTAQKWCEKLGIPVFNVKLEFIGFGDKVVILHILYRVGADVKKASCRINLR